MMRISRIEVANFKIFHGNHSFDIGNNLIFLVGENNTGKSTLFEAINFLKSGLPDKKKIGDFKNKLATENEHIVCTVKFKGDIKTVINSFSEAKYEPYVFDENGEETLLVQRSSENRIVKQGGKDKQLTVKSITLWNPETSQFENPSGVDSVLGSLFETQFIWADTDPADVSDFGATKIGGRLLNGAMGDFFDGEQWKEFISIHQQTFHGEGDSLSKRTKTVEKKIENVLREQYGDIGFKFNFDLPETSTFFKAGHIQVNDGVETELNQKGTGLQRSVALAMIQVYANNLIAHPTETDKNKPLFFFIDEPELCLHPKAQQQLVKALLILSQVQQIFISTHSPYLLKSFNAAENGLFICERVKDNVKITPANQMKLFSWSPSWGEINFVAYKMATLEFHDELFGAVHERFISEAPDSNEAGRRGPLRVLDLEILAKNDPVNQTYTWSELRRGIQQSAYPVSKSTFVRNSMHHPESRQTTQCTESDLEESINYLISLLTA
jgi:putative ATP-dependent endonuclease of OLD family